MNPEPTNPTPDREDGYAKIWQEIGKLQAKADGPAERSPYATASLITATVSLLISLVSSGFTIIHEQEKDTSQLRAELVGYVQSLTQLSARQANEDEVYTVATQASEIALKLPDIPATMYRRIAESIINYTSYLDKADPLLDKAIQRAVASNDFYEQILVHRVRANSMAKNRNLEGARREFRSAIDISEKYNGRNWVLKNYAPIYTAIYSGIWEFNFGNCVDANKSLVQAKRYAGLAYSSDQMKYDQSRPHIEKALMDFEKQLGTCRTSAAIAQQPAEPPPAKAPGETG
jgi:tetratricopeptide (TPR) repeat protein